MDSLTAALAELADSGLPARTGAQLLDDTRALIAARNRLDAEPARRVRVADGTEIHLLRPPTDDPHLARAG